MFACGLTSTKRSACACAASRAPRSRDLPAGRNLPQKALTRAAIKHQERSSRRVPTTAISASTVPRLHHRESRRQSAKAKENAAAWASVLTARATIRGLLTAPRACPPPSARAMRRRVVHRRARRRRMPPPLANHMLVKSATTPAHPRPASQNPAAGGAGQDARPVRRWRVKDHKRAVVVVKPWQAGLRSGVGAYHGGWRAWLTIYPHGTRMAA